MSLQKGVHQSYLFNGIYFKKGKLIFLENRENDS